MTDNRTTELLPCPCCDSESIKELAPDEWGDSANQYWKIKCMECGLTMCGTNRRMNQEAWNTRTPEQAIAATLGRQKTKSHPYGYERDTGCYDSTRCECGCINDISARYCNDCGGEIEIDESAEKEYYDGYSKHTVFAKKHDDGSLEFCERRYVLEDAATLGSEREAELVKTINDVLRHATDTVWVSEAETLVDRMVSLGIYEHDVYEGARPWEVD